MSEPLLTKGEILEALMAASGNISATARALNVRRSYIQDKVDADPALRTIQIEYVQEVLDRAEDNIFNAVHRGDEAQSQFVLKTLGKDRGYSVRQENTGKNGGPVPFAGDININFVSPLAIEEEIE